MKNSGKVIASSLLALAGAFVPSGTVYVCERGHEESISREREITSNGKISCKKCCRYMKKKEIR